MVAFAPLETVCSWCIWGSMHLMASDNWYQWTMRHWYGRINHSKCLSFILWTRELLIKAHFLLCLLRDIENPVWYGDVGLSSAPAGCNLDMRRQSSAWPNLTPAHIPTSSTVTSSLSEPLNKVWRHFRLYYTWLLELVNVASSQACREQLLFYALQFSASFQRDWTRQRRSTREKQSQWILTLNRCQAEKLFRPAPNNLRPGWNA